MTGKDPIGKKKNSVDWFFQGVLTKLGDALDRLTGRRWTPSSSLAASELIERLKKLLDAEAKSVPGKGLVVPHNIKLRMQWDKFSDDADVALKKLEIELLTAAVDHINDSLYYTFAPVSLEVKPDYFVEGVKLKASFDDFTEEDRNVELNVTIPAMNVSALIPSVPAIKDVYLAQFKLSGIPKERRLEFPSDGNISVGRTGSNALVIDDPSVSKIHASLSVNNEGNMLVADTGSTNGTFINDVRIAYGKATAIEPSDVVKFGLVDVRFEYVPKPMIAAKEELGEESTDEATEIDGFEFRSGSTSAPADTLSSPVPLEERSESRDLPDDTIRAIPVPQKGSEADNIGHIAKTEPDVTVPKTAEHSQISNDDEPVAKY